MRLRQGDLECAGRGPVTSDLEPGSAARLSSRRIRNFDTLDGLCGIAAIGVAIGHGRFLAAGTPTSLFSECCLAVDFIFLLSGFILAHAYGERLCSDMSTVRRWRPPMPRR